MQETLLRHNATADYPTDLGPLANRVNRGKNERRSLEAHRRHRVLHPKKAQKPKELPYADRPLQSANRPSCH